MNHVSSLNGRKKVLKIKAYDSLKVNLDSFGEFELRIITVNDLSFIIGLLEQEKK